GTTYCFFCPFTIRWRGSISRDASTRPVTCNESSICSIAASSSAAFHDPVSSRHTPPKGEISGSTTDSLVLGLHIIFCCTLQMHGVWFWSPPSMKHTSPSHRRCTPPPAQSSYHVERPPGGTNTRIFE